MSDENIQFIEANNNSEEVIKNLNSLDIVLSGLLNQIEENLKEQGKSEKKKQELQLEIKGVKKPEYYPFEARDIILNTGTFQ